MKKIMCMFIFSIISQFAFPQSEAILFLSMGFNTKQDSRGDTIHYFFGYDDYSEALIYDSHFVLSTVDGGFYPNGNIRYGFAPYTYNRYTGKNNSVGYYWEIPTQGLIGMEYKFENGKLVYWAEGYGLQRGRTPDTILQGVEQTDQEITIYSTDSDNENFRERYYNVSKTELLDIFLKNYIEIICEIKDIGNTDKRRFNFEDNFDRYISLFIRSRTSRELAIFRNCLYAIKGYRFANSTWTEFFNKYLDGYNGRYTNDEVTAMFTENEKWLLDLIIRYENRR